MAVTQAEADLPSTSTGVGAMVRLVTRCVAIPVLSGGITARDRARVRDLLVTNHHGLGFQVGVNTRLSVFTADP